MRIKFLLLEINTSIKFLLFGMNYITYGGVYLITDTCNFFIIPLCKWTYSFVYYLISYVISLYQLNYYFLMPYEIWKQCRKF